MEKMVTENTKQARTLKVLRFLFIIVCFGGFLYQTLQFLLLYWTYPTVGDIQQIEPSKLEMPSFTICNTIGYNFKEICDGGACLPTVVNRFSGKKFCNQFPEFCFEGELPYDFQVVTYTKYMKNRSLTYEDHERLRVRLKDYMTCTIEFAGEVEECDLDNIMGSFYSQEDMPQYCYTIYSLWGQPDKKRALIHKGAVMNMRFVLNTTMRPDVNEKVEKPKPRYNIPGNPTVQIAVHSPYFLPSPFLDGMSFIGGRAYELRLKMNERHLLPAPYHTNCTDYMKMWRERGGKAPINQMGVVQECRINKTYENIKCIPITLDYPHNYTLCGGCYPEVCNYSTFSEECGKLAAHYTQPCDAMTYDAEKEDRVATTFEIIDSVTLKIRETVRKKIVGYDCFGSNMWKKECATIDVHIPFDRFEITNLTYNPKFESSELFGVIGGYLGMWLGISLLMVYDFIVSIIVMIWTYRQKKREEAVKFKEDDQVKHGYSDQSNYESNLNPDANALNAFLKPTNKIDVW